MFTEYTMTHTKLRTNFIYQSVNIRINLACNLPSMEEVMNATIILVE